LVASKVGYPSFTVKLQSECFAEDVDTGAQFVREFVDVGFPIFFGNKLLRFPVPVFASEIHLSMDVLSEAFFSSFVMFQPGVLFWHRAEF
jgi:hypothetical protein